MNRMLALVLLAVGFLQDIVVSGWATARVILRGGELPQTGFVYLSYEDLPDGAAAFLGALITLTPGTTTVDIDPVRREFLLHLLDMTRAEATVATIRRNFLRPVRILSGGGE